MEYGLILKYIGIPIIVIGTYIVYCLFDKIGRWLDRKLDKEIKTYADW